MHPGIVTGHRRGPREQMDGLLTWRLHGFRWWRPRDHSRSSPTIAPNGPVTTRPPCRGEDVDVMNVKCPMRR